MSRQWRSDDTDKWKYGFGKGGDGSTYTAPANAGCSGTAASTTLTLDAASTFQNGDLILIHQSRGSNANSTTAGVVNWELNKIVSGGGTTTLTLAYPLDITYVDSGASQSQVIEMKEYNNLTLSGTITPAKWDGNTGGIGGFFNKGTLSGSSATLNLAGSQGASVSATSHQGGATGGGFRGGHTRTGNSGGAAHQGEGTAGDRGTASTSANGNGSGGGSLSAGIAGSGGGANANNGSNGSSDAATTGAAGQARGAAELIRAVFGGGSGGGRRDTSAASGAGSSGGGLWFIFSENIDLTGITVTLNGGAGRSASGGPSGGAAGGSCLVKCVSATLGTNKITATGGASSSNTDGKPATGGAGSVGRIHIDYSKSYTGSTSPTLDVRQDNTIKAMTGGANYYQYFL